MGTRQADLQRIRECFAEIERSLWHPELSAMVEPSLTELVDLAGSADNDERATARKMLNTYQEMFYKRVRLIEDDKDTDISPGNLLKIIQMFYECGLIDLPATQTMQTIIDCRIIEEISPTRMGRRAPR